MGFEGAGKMNIPYEEALEGLLVVPAMAREECFRIVCMKYSKWPDDVVNDLNKLQEKRKELEQ
jgi:hypothetical protein